MSKTVIGYTIIISFLVVAGMLSINLYFKQRSAHDILDIHNLPLTIGEWHGSDLEITNREYDILETRNLISRQYVNADNKKIYLFVIYSETNRSVFHPPEVCLMGDGIKITKKSTEDFALDNNRHFIANLLLTEKGNYKHSILLTYKIGDFYTDGYYLQQIFFALNQLFNRRKGGATIRVAMPSGDDNDRSLATLKNFLRKTIQELETLEQQTLQS